MTLFSLGYAIMHYRVSTFGTGVLMLPVIGGRCMKLVNGETAYFVALGTHSQLYG
jgi:hypothetical protein